MTAPPTKSSTLEHLQSVCRGVIIGVVLAACISLLWWVAVWTDLPLWMRAFCITVFTLAQIARLTAQLLKEKGNV